MKTSTYNVLTIEAYVVDVSSNTFGLCLSQTGMLSTVIIVLNIHTKGFKYYYEMVNDYPIVSVRL